MATSDRGNRTRDQRYHLTRITTVDAVHPVDSLSQVRYTAMGGVNPFRLTLPVSGRDQHPDERRRVRAHFVNVRRSVGGTPVMGGEASAPPDALLRSTPGPAVRRDGRAPAGSPAVDHGVGRRAPGRPAGRKPLGRDVPSSGGDLTPSTPLADAVRARPGFDANDLNVVMVAEIYERQAVFGRLANLSNAESFPGPFARRSP